ncbi:hypothetical protein MBANPS3_012624, partial [Mucor bainieri]
SSSFFHKYIFIDDIAKVMAVLRTFFVKNLADGMKSAAEAHGVPYGKARYFISKSLANTQFAVFQKSAVKLSRAEEDTLKNERLQIIALMVKQANNNIAKIREKAATSAPEAHPVVNQALIWFLVPESKFMQSQGLSVCQVQ